MSHLVQITVCSVMKYNLLKEVLILLWVLASADHPRIIILVEHVIWNFHYWEDQVGMNLLLIDMGYFTLIVSMDQTLMEIPGLIKDKVLASDSKKKKYRAPIWVPCTYAARK